MLSRNEMEFNRIIILSQPHFFFLEAPDTVHTVCRIVLKIEGDLVLIIHKYPGAAGGIVKVCSEKAILREEAGAAAPGKIQFVFVIICCNIAAAIIQGLRDLPVVGYPFSFRAKTQPGTFGVLLTGSYYNQDRNNCKN